VKHEKEKDHKHAEDRPSALANQENAVRCIKIELEADSHRDHVRDLKGIAIYSVIARGRERGVVRTDCCIDCTVACLAHGSHFAATVTLPAQRGESLGAVKVRQFSYVKSIQTCLRANGALLIHSRPLKVGDADATSTRIRTGLNPGMEGINFVEKRKRLNQTRLV